MAIICTAHNLLRKAWKRAWKTSGDIEERSGELEQRWRKAFCASCQDKISSCLFCSMLLLKFCRGISMNLWHYDYHYYVPYGYVRYMFVTCSIFSDLFFGEFPCAKVKGTEELAPITKEWSYLSIRLGMLGVEFSQSSSDSSEPCFFWW